MSVCLCVCVFAVHMPKGLTLARSTLCEPSAMIAVVCWEAELGVARRVARLPTSVALVHSSSSSQLDEHCTEPETSGQHVDFSGAEWTCMQAGSWCGWRAGWGQASENKLQIGNGK